MKAADTSVVVAAFASWHEHHDRARSGAYDALVAATAAAHSASLITCDRRAVLDYESYGLQATFIG